MARQHDEEVLQLRLGVARRLVHVDQVLDLGEREAEALAAQRQPQARAVARGVDALAAAAPRREQAAVLVEADRAGGQIEFARQLADREGRRGRRRTAGRVAGREAAARGIALNSH